MFHNTKSPTLIYSIKLTNAQDTLRPVIVPANTNDPTHDIKPDKKELNGNVPTRQQ